MRMLSSSAYAFLFEASPAHPCMPQQLAHLFFIIWFQSSALTKEVVILHVQGRKQTMYCPIQPYVPITLNRKADMLAAQPQQDYH